MKKEKFSLKPDQQDTHVPRGNAGCSCSIPGCMMMILFGVLIAVAVKECKRSDLRLKQEQKSYQIMQDSINKQMRDTSTVFLR